MFLCGWTCQCMGEPVEPDCACTVWRILCAFLGGHPIKRAGEIYQPPVSVCVGVGVCCVCGRVGVSVSVRLCVSGCVLCVYDCAFRALYLPNRPANWTATLGSIPGQHHKPLLSTPLARSTDLIICTDLNV
jgi:hypothetical protein